MKKVNYKEKFERENFPAMALQLVDDKSKGRSITSKKKRRSSTTKPRKYEKLPVKELIPNIKFVEKNTLNEFLYPAHWFRTFIPESQKKEIQIARVCKNSAILQI